MLNIAICDDDKLFVKRFSLAVKNNLETHKISAEISHFTTGNQLIESFLSGSNFNLVFLDIDMPEVNGKEVARELRQLNKEFILIFVSSFTQEVFDTFCYDTSCFIPKDQLDNRLKIEFPRILELIENNNHKCCLFDIINSYGVKSQIKVRQTSIVYLESLNRSVFLHTNNEVFRLMSNRYEKAKQLLLPFGFVETHRICIVNPAYIYSIERDMLILDNKETLPLSRRKKEKVILAMTNIVREGA